MNTPKNPWWERLIRGLRWPAAIVSLLILPYLLLVWSYLLPQLFVYWIRTLAMVVGALVYWFGWRPWSKRMRIGDRAVSGETMLTRGTVRWLTHCASEQSNWLVSISPYFVPTAAILLAIVAALIPIPLVPWSSLVLGFALAYHARAIRVVYRTNPKEIRKLGWFWSALFLPGANLLALSILLAMGLEGVELVSKVFSQAFGFLTTRYFS